MGYYKSDEESDKLFKRWGIYAGFAPFIVLCTFYTLMHWTSFYHRYRNEWDMDTMSMDPHTALKYSLVNFVVFAVLQLLILWFLYRRRTIVVAVLHVLFGVLAVASSYIFDHLTRCC